MSISKRIEEARRAYEERNLQASAAAHTPGRIADMAQEEHGGTGSAYIGDLVYGGLDGIITTFAVVSGVAGADLGLGIVLIMGLANLFADGFSMATGAYLSAKSEKEYFAKEREREGWEVENFPDGERTELYEIYLHQGYPEEDARQLVEIKTRDRDRWVDTMMVEELGMMKEERHPLKNALATLAAFIMAGVVPLLVYLVGIIAPVAPDPAFFVSLVSSGLALFGLGMAKVLVTRQNPFKSGLEMLLVGGLAAGVAYGIGVLLKGLGGVV